MIFISLMLAYIAKAFSAEMVEAPVSEASLNQHH